MKLKIKITKQILEESKMCGIEKTAKWVSKNCAIAVAVREIFPKASVMYTAIAPFGIFAASLRIIDLPEEATEFISHFDKSSPEERINLPEFEFEIDISEEVINSISLPEIEKIISNSETLEIIH